jgi:dihydrofolate reductase
MLSAVVAMSENRVIGKDNKLPWHMPADLAHFKKITLGKPIIMGRKTYESIGRPLPGRRNLILTRDKSWVMAGCEVFHSVDAVLAALEGHDASVIGGAEIFSAFMPSIEKLYLTVIHFQCEGDAFLPALDLQKWQITSKETHAADAANPYAYTFFAYQKHITQRR